MRHAIVNALSSISPNTAPLAFDCEDADRHLCVEIRIGRIVSKYVVMATGGLSPSLRHMQVNGGLVELARSQEVRSSDLVRVANLGEWQASSPCQVGAELAAERKRTMP